MRYSENLPESMMVSKPETTSLPSTRALAPLICQKPWPEEETS